MRSNAHDTYTVYVTRLPASVNQSARNFPLATSFMDMKLFPILGVHPQALTRREIPAIYPIHQRVILKLDIKCGNLGLFGEVQGLRPLRQDTGSANPS